MSALLLTLAALSICLAGTGAAQIARGEDRSGSAIGATIFLTVVAFALAYAGLHG